VCVNDVESALGVGLEHRLHDFLAFGFLEVTGLRINNFEVRLGDGVNKSLVAVFRRGGARFTGKFENAAGAAGLF